MPTVALPAVTGAQQSAIADAFRAAGWHVTGTSRKPAPGIYVADLETGEGLPEAFAGASAVIFTMPQDHRPDATRRMAASIAEATHTAGVSHLVMNAAGRIDENAAAEVFVTLRAVRDLFRAGPVPFTLIEPTVFMDNLLQPWSLPGIASGTLAYPAEPQTPVAWISHRTLGKAIVAATARPGGETLKIGGAPLTSAALTEILAARVGHLVAYVQIPLPAFVAGMNRGMGAPAGDRIGEFYAHLADHPEFMADGADALSRLGVVPESFADFVARNDWSLPA